MMNLKTRFKNPGQKRQILLVDPHPVFRRGLAQLINLHPELAVCGETDNAQTGMSLVDNLKPNLVVAGLALRMSLGIELIKDLKARHPAIPVLVFSMHEESLYGARALKAGARGYIMKTESVDDTIAAIRRVLSGHIHLSHDMGTRMLNGFSNGGTIESDSPIDRLTDRELEVLQLLGRAYETRQIAEVLRVSIKTVESYREHIKIKLKLRNSTQLIHRAVEWVISVGL